MSEYQYYEFRALDRMRGTVPCQGPVRRARFTSTEVVYGVSGTDVTVLPTFGVAAVM